MDRAAVVLVTLVAYNLVLLAIGLVAHRRTQSAADYLLGGRRLGPFVAALAASASSSSAWTLLGVSGYAYQNGLSAIWLFPGCVGGFVLNWWLVARSLRRYAADHGALTAIDVLAAPTADPDWALRVRRLAAAIAVISLLAYVSAQFQAAGAAFAESFGTPRLASIAIGAAVVMAYVFLGGYWAIALTDTVQGLLMVGAALIVPVAALVAVGGPAGMWAAIQAVDSPGYASPTAGLGTGAALGVVLGLLGIGLGYPGQPHVLNSLMALRDDRALAAARRIALLWAVLIYAGMLVVGWCGRALNSSLAASHERILIVVANDVLPAWLGGLVIAAILSAIMSTVDSQLLVIGTSVARDARRSRADDALAVRRSRGGVIAVSAAAFLLAVLVERSIFDRVLSAWTALGAAFGPLLVANILGRPPRPAIACSAMLVGCASAALAHAHGETLFVRNALPILLAGLVVFAGGRRPQTTDPGR
jgi:sodium/proline symporter